jgi:hypothetical protein
MNKTTCLFSLLCLSFFRVYAVIVYGNDIETVLPSYYTTLGTYPTAARTLNISVVQSNMIEQCNLNPSKSSAGSLEGYILVLNGDIPMFRACNIDLHASATTLGVLAQEQGALGVIVEQFDEVRQFFAKLFFMLIFDLSAIIFILFKIL